jgi:16S rRNA (cytidine1402-2'-O)-methyltransferase
MRAGTLYLIPTALGGIDVTELIPAATLSTIHRLGHFVVESAKSARAFLKAAGHPRPLQELEIATLDEHTPASRAVELLRPLLDGHDCGLLSEAGSPAVADPGATLVRAAHARGIRVVPLVGPSALLLALMSSGMNGQHFAFHGYLPIERVARERRLAELEAESAKKGMTQIFIEAPYRNEALYEAIVRTCKPDTLLCLATDLTLSSETVHTRPVSEWRKARPALERRPTVFLLYRESAVSPSAASLTQLP